MNHLHCLIVGDVQGVGFRSWAQYQAGKLGITGWVKNRNDGTVELTAYGNQSQLKQFITVCKRGPDTALVTSIDVHWMDSDSPPPADFSILH